MHALRVCPTKMIPTMNGRFTSIELDIGRLGQKWENLAVQEMECRLPRQERDILAVQAPLRVVLMTIRALLRVVMNHRLEMVMSTTQKYVVCFSSDTSFSSPFFVCSQIHLHSRAHFYHFRNFQCLNLLLDATTVYSVTTMMKIVQGLVMILNL